MKYLSAWDSMLGMPMMKMVMAAIQTITFRGHFFSSTRKVIGISSRDIVEVRAAKHSKRKNPPPIIFPVTIPISEKTPGKATNRRPGPADGDCPWEKTRGKIINPARNATTVSVIVTNPAELVKLSCFLR